MICLQRRSDTPAGRVHGGLGLQELHGMELDEELTLPISAGVDILTHRISLARLQHVSNLAWCLGSWLPHLVSLSVLLIRLVSHRPHQRLHTAKPSGNVSRSLHRWFLLTWT